MSQEIFEKLYSEFNLRLHNKQYEGALSLVTDLLENAQNNDVDIFYTLMGKASAQTSLGMNLEVIDTYSHLIERFKDSKNELIFKYLAFAYYNKALIFAKELEYELELETYDALLEKYIMDISDELEIVLVKAYINKAVCVSELKSPKDAVEVYQELISNFESSKDDNVLEQVATAAYNIALIHGKYEEFEESIKYYDYIISKFDETNDENNLELVAKSYVNKASRLRDLSKFDESLAEYDKVVERFENYSGKILKQVALALHNKSVLLGQLQRETELQDVCDLIIEKFANSQDDMIMNIVSTAQVIKEKDQFNNNAF